MMLGIILSLINTNVKNFNVPEVFYPLRQSFPQFMVKCYKPETSGLDTKIYISTKSKYGSAKAEQKRS